MNATDVSPTTAGSLILDACDSRMLRIAREQVRDADRAWMDARRQADDGHHLDLYEPGIADEEHRRRFNEIMGRYDVIQRAYTRYTEALLQLGLHTARILDDADARSV